MILPISLKLNSPKHIHKFKSQVQSASQPHKKQPLIFRSSPHERKGEGEGEFHNKDQVELNEIIQRILDEFDNPQLTSSSTDLTLNIAIGEVQNNIDSFRERTSNILGREISPEEAIEMIRIHFNLKIECDPESN